MEEKIILGMAMPKSCEECPFSQMDFSDCIAVCLANDHMIIEDGCDSENEKRSINCPLKAVTL